MDCRERYVRALTFDGPDRAPLMHHTIGGAWRVHGEALTALYAEYPSDVLLSATKHGPFTYHDCQRGAWADGETTRDDWGCQWLWNTPDYMGQTVDHPLKDWSDLAGYRPPDPMTGEQGVQQMVAEVDADDHRHFVFVDGGEVFQRMFFLRGMEELLIDLHEDRPEIYTLRDMITDHCLQRITRWLATDRVDGVILRDDWGTQTSLMVEPAVWRRVFKPAYARLVDAIHDGGAYASFHSDGVISAIVPDLVEIGCDELNPQVQLMDLEGLSRDFNGRVCIRADIDRQQTLPYGTPDDVRELVSRLFAAFGRDGGGYVGWGEMSSDVPLANCEAMLQAIVALRYE
ncbi:MAG: uroporphyrinogen decarboxylase family protein [Candidatus Latescibacteria bacterium]|nr:hypothetical protein [Gemmatimonadaceae bacterium]MDP6015772.1 uroporphyrinogen decarboxylase family protein [Candidatus Latescibacterota bacterium]MDP7449000.1 uroporphyrinogen decarboxylase family protein [Candidatus Latescibacterota bacterium]HJP31039.1 uroporphyrinogen decarboxylase family protein [Candidatus Latescibacterota bacterium]